MGLSKISLFYPFIWCLILLICKESNANCEMSIDNIRLPNVLNYGNKTYFIDLNKKLNWINANLACKQYNMELLTIDTDEEFDFIDIHISKMENNIQIWTSGTDLGAEGAYKWMSNGRKICSNRWHKNQPDNAGSAEHCIQFLKHESAILLNDNKCDITIGYICQSIAKTYCEKQNYLQIIWS
ncbi:PREDICTED: C-type lectin 37Da-like [Nicrophorus vespilloides]|uniref:C-type lectin 37Da-like n=1 Tax=Nicrophorus vespilloides TaxID=110193 RepID=A0ABM1MSM2_NICVS|nr:PREDICTED: C-type lectin 37Da-like [Nicrophorus vespilloides]